MSNPTYTDGVPDEDNRLHSVRAELHPDPKPAKRIVDRHVFELFHDRQWSCVSCGRERNIVAHHILRRGQSGDDVMANLAPLCDPCHRAYHGTPYKWSEVWIDAKYVQRCLARYIHSEAGEDTRAYLVAKLGVHQALDFVERLEA